MPQPKKIKSDGKDWMFTPGANGSLVTPPMPMTSSNSMVNGAPVSATAKSIGYRDEETKKNRKNLIRTLVAASRG